MAHYGVLVTVEEGKKYPTTYSYVVDTQAQVKQLLAECSAPIAKVIVTEEVYGRDPYAREMSAEEILGIVLSNPAKREEAISLA